MSNSQTYELRTFFIPLNITHKCKEIVGSSQIFLEIPHSLRDGDRWRNRTRVSLVLLFFH